MIHPVHHPHFHVDYPSAHFRSSSGLEIGTLTRWYFVSSGQYHLVWRLPYQWALQPDIWTTTTSMCACATGSSFLEQTSFKMSRYINVKIALCGFIIRPDPALWAAVKEQDYSSKYSRQQFVYETIPNRRVSFPCHLPHRECHMQLHLHDIAQYNPMHRQSNLQMGSLHQIDLPGRRRQHVLCTKHIQHLGTCEVEERVLQEGAPFRKIQGCDGQGRSRGRGTGPEYLRLQ